MFGKALKKCFGYIRVSTLKQGEKGVSLQEQKEAIIRYAERNGLQIIRWFEERETAAKRGRPVFNAMLKLLRSGKGEAVVIHKIDRSARNLRDWADLGELIDNGIDVYFANESLDLHSRGGRLSADIQAVVAADFIRNLREETRKGFYGRLKQGLYPLPAPIGYLDQGKGNPKIPDPTKAPFVRKAFETYATGRYSLDQLVEIAAQWNLTSRFRGGRISRNGLSTMLNNPFYIGIIRIYETGETFPGKHEPIVPAATFRRVQSILRGRTPKRPNGHLFIFRRTFKCGLCQRILTGELKKGHVYYRCHTPSCPTKCIREEELDRQIREALEPLQLNDGEKLHVHHRLTERKQDWIKVRENQIRSMELQLNSIDERFNRLTDAYIEQIIDRDVFEQRKTALLLSKRELQDGIDNLKRNPQSLFNSVVQMFELLGSAYLRYISAIDDEKREIVKDVSSNCFIIEKNVSVELKFPIDELAKSLKSPYCDPCRDTVRTGILDVLIERGIDIASKEMEKERKAKAA
jgi:DNA invertase Pin-like site-specific DNA recombinase